jgi:hypothetical protein
MVRRNGLPCFVISLTTCSTGEDGGRFKFSFEDGSSEEIEGIE